MLRRGRRPRRRLPSPAVGKVQRSELAEVFDRGQVVRSGRQLRRVVRAQVNPLALAVGPHLATGDGRAPAWGLLGLVDALEAAAPQVGADLVLTVLADRRPPQIALAVVQWVAVDVVDYLTGLMTKHLVVHHDGQLRGRPTPPDSLGALGVDTLRARPSLRAPLVGQDARRIFGVDQGDEPLRQDHFDGVCEARCCAHRPTVL
jgi:hypothetical protein